jgi:hypothetical protein
MRSKYFSYKDEVIKLRKKGMTYGEIIKDLNLLIPKSTLSDWCENISSDPKYKLVLERAARKNISKGHIFALKANKIKREKYLQSIRKNIKHLNNIFKNKDVAKISLSMLYLGEGSKTRRGSIMFGNSDPEIIKIFLRMLRYCYNIDEEKFRCTLQCRADQDIKTLEKFWSKATNIPLEKFYKARIDPRTIGKISKKPDYKGVCRIDYFSAHIYNELMAIIELMYKTGL